jgi:hypothetical protein
MGAFHLVDSRAHLGFAEYSLGAIVPENARMVVGVSYTDWLLARCW